MAENTFVAEVTFNDSFLYFDDTINPRKTIVVLGVKTDFI